MYLPSLPMVCSARLLTSTSPNLSLSRWWFWTPFPSLPSQRRTPRLSSCPWPLSWLMLFAPFTASSPCLRSSRRASIKEFILFKKIVCWSHYFCSLYLRYGEYISILHTFFWSICLFGMIIKVLCLVVQLIASALDNQETPILCKELWSSLILGLYVC